MTTNFDVKQWKSDSQPIIAFYEYARFIKPPANASHLKASSHYEYDE